MKCYFTKKKHEWPQEKILALHDRKMHIKTTTKFYVLLTKAAIIQKLNSTNY